MGKADTSENNVEEEDDDETTSRNPHPSDSETAIDDHATTDNSTNPNIDAVGSSTRKRTTIDESTLSVEDLQKLESRRAYNRHCAAKARKRSKTLVAQLQSQVEELTKDKAELKRSNDLMRTQLDLLEQQNRTLLMNQLSAQPSSSQLTGGSFAPGGSISSPNALMSMSNNVGNHANGISSMSSGNPMFNLPSAAFAATGNGTIGSGSLVGDASGLSNASASFMGMGNGGGGSGLGQLSLLDRLRLQQQLQLQQQQRQQQQQLGLMAPSSGVNGRASLNERDLLLNNIRNNSNNNNSNFLG